MTDATTAPTPAPASPPLDEVMLAMDVVDTLRAHRELVQKELDDEGRARTFADRIKSIYASQGIDVPDSVIREAVEALEQDRFTYRPPERTFGVRLAEIYVDRASWMRRAAGVLAILLLIWGGVAWSKARHDRGLEEAFVARQGLLGKDVETTGERIESLRRQLGEIERQATAGSVVAGLTTETAALLGEVDARHESLMRASSPLDPEAYPDDQRRMDATLETRRRAVGEIQEDLGRVEGQLDAIRRLQGLSGRITVVLARLAGITPTPVEQARLDRLRGEAQAALQAGDADTAEARVDDLRAAVAALVGAAEAKRRLEAAFTAVSADLDGMRIEAKAKTETDQLRGRVRAALAAGDPTAAQAHLADLQTLARVLGAAYELHILSRPGVQSGVWRYPDDRPNVRNFYILVEPIGPDGRTLSIPVRNEENQTTVMVTRFGIRVPEKVFEAVKQDKLDNGIVDKKVFGAKKRGELEPTYRFEIAGGWITDW